MKFLDLCQSEKKFEMATSKVTLGLVQMATTSDRKENIRKASEMTAEAAERGAQIVCLPELFASKYFPRKQKARAVAERVPGPTSRALASMASQNKVILVGGSIYEKTDGYLYNTCLVFGEDGKILGRYHKVHIPHDTNYYEQNYFSPGNKFSVVSTKHGKIGTLICFDQWYPEAARVVRLMGAQVIFYPTAIGWVKGIEPTEGDWHEAWEKVQRSHAIANNVVVCTVNRVGVEGETTFWGGSFVYDQFGKLLVKGDDKEGVYLATCDLNYGREMENLWGFFRNRRPETYHSLVRKPSLD
jgi:predicted amidohydrolase